MIVYEIERHQQSDATPVFEAIRRDVSRQHELLVDAIRLVRSNSIPKTSSGKIQRHACRNAFLDNTLEVVAQWDAAVHDVAPAEEPESAESFDQPRTNGVAAESPPTHEHPVPVVHDTAPAASSNGAGRPTKKKSTAEQVLEEVHRIAKERSRGLTLDSSIPELGLDSLERMEILAAIEERFGGRFPEEVLPQLETCRDVVDAVEKYLGKAARPAEQEQIRPEVPAEYYRFDRYPEYVALKQKLEGVAAIGLGNPYFNVHQGVTRDTTMIGGRELINFSSYNYVGTSGDPIVTQAAKDAIDRYGTSVSASRLVSGEKVVHRELERAIAEFIGTDDAIVYVGGHSTNETTIGHLFGPGDSILHDQLGTTASFKAAYSRARAAGRFHITTGARSTSY